MPINYDQHSYDEMKLNGNGITEESCAALASALHSNPLYLRKLDLSGNKVGKSGMEKLGILLESPKCELDKLGLSDCSITEEGWTVIVSAVEKNPTYLKELDLSKNKIEGSGLDQVSTLLKNPKCVLDTLKLSDCHITGDGYAALALALKSNPSSNLIELDLRRNNPGDNGVEMLANLLQDENFKLETLRLLKSDDAVQAHAFLSEYLKQDPLLLNELNLRNRKLDSTQMKQLSALLVDSHCKAKTLGLNECELTEDSCEHLATALISEDSELTELNLSNSKLGDSSVQKISTALMNRTCKLEILRLTKCSVIEADCAALSSALCSNLSHLTELDLSDNKLGNSGVKQICSLLKDQSCKLQSLGLSFCSITEEGFAALTSALKSNPSSHLIKLDLRGNYPGDTEMEELVKLYGTSHKKLRLLNSEDAEEAYSCLHRLIQEDPLLLKGLDLSRREPKHIQVKQLSALLEDPHFRLEKLTLYKSGSITKRDCADLISALTVNPSHLRELDLNQNELDQSGVQKLCTLLQNPDCKLEKLKLNTCSIEEEGCADLTSALTSNPSHLRELDLRGNDKLGDSVKALADLLQESGCKLQ
ncbi:hypothetical protein NFI96_027132 [Prochilodus magdalenae]|nr:hypothetical protein NFI96_027132 [Prochilodus magdalenae]